MALGPAGAATARPPPRPRTLVVIEDGHTLARLRLPPAPATRLVGRDRGAWLHLENTAVSRRHALISARGGTCRIRDLGSTNGTFVNGEPVTVAAQPPRGRDPPGRGARRRPLELRARAARA